jgi:hypothetical protein
MVISQTYRLLLCGLALAGQFFCTMPAFAAEGRGITITPTSIDLVVTPGELYTGNFQILNQGAAAYDFTIEPALYHVEDEDYTPDFTYLPGTARVNDWFRFTILKEHIEPNEIKDIGYHIVVPPGTTPGGYYAVAFAQTQFPRTPDNIVLNQRVGVIFYLQVAGSIEQKSRVASWRADFLQRPPLATELRLQNDGAAHYLAKTVINVKDLFGRTKYTATIDRYVLPHTIRNIKMSWDKAPPIGLFKVSGTVEALGEKSTLPTRYVLVMSNAARIIIIGLALLGVLIAGLRFLWYIRTRKPKKKKK